MDTQKELYLKKSHNLLSTGISFLPVFSQNWERLGRETCPSPIFLPIMLYNQPWTKETNLGRDGGCGSAVVSPITTHGYVDGSRGPIAIKEFHMPCLDPCKDLELESGISGLFTIYFTLAFLGIGSSGFF